MQSVDEPRLAYSSITVNRAADECYRLLRDIQSTPDWVPGVADVNVLESDADGHVLVAEFIAMPSRASVLYCLRYTYDPAARSMTWESADRVVRDLTGEASVAAIDETSSTVSYGLSSAVTQFLPDWAQLVLREETPAPITEAFKRWAERIV